MTPVSRPYPPPRDVLWFKPPSPQIPSTFDEVLRRPETHVPLRGNGSAGYRTDVRDKEPNARPKSRLLIAWKSLRNHPSA
jgi:hypothetical protein